MEENQTTSGWRFFRQLRTGKSKRIAELEQKLQLAEGDVARLLDALLTLQRQYGELQDQLAQVHSIAPPYLSVAAEPEAPYGYEPDRKDSRPPRDYPIDE